MGEKGVQKEVSSTINNEHHMKDRKFVENLSFQGREESIDNEEDEMKKGKNFVKNLTVGEGAFSSTK